MKKTVRAVAALALLTTCAYAQEKDSTKVNSLNEVVVSDTKFAQSKEKSGKVIEVISAKDLERKSGQTLASVLSQVAGVEINGNQSGSGKDLGLFVRGGKNSQVLVLIDGIPVTDASGMAFSYDLRLLPVDQVERIEIMKGAASTLYGTGAATGVINITLKKAAKKEIQGNGYMNVGSNNTAHNQKLNAQDFNGGFSVNGADKKGKVTYLAGFNSTVTGGISQIAEPTPDVKYEADKFERINFLSKFGIKATNRLSFDFFGNYDKISTDYDGTFDNTNTNDNSVNHSISKQTRFGFTPKYKYEKGEFVLNSGFTKISRDYNELNPYTAGVDYSLYESRNVSLDGVNKYNFNAEMALILGMNYQFYDMLGQTPFGNTDRENTKFNILDTYTTFVYNSDFGLNLNVGGRLNYHSEYGNHFVGNFNPSYNFETDFPLKVLASYSTAFISPSLFQLYSQFGSKDLTPEKNNTVEAGFETELFAKKMKINTVAFYREQDNTINFLSSSYANIDGVHKAKGIETTVIVALTSKLRLNGNYTFTNVDEALDRLIPKHKVNAGLDFQATGRMLFNVNYQYLSSRNDMYFSGVSFDVVNAKLDSYQLLNALFKYEVIKNRLSVFGTATNIFNEAFQENIGYNTRGRNIKFGLNITL